MSEVTYQQEAFAAIWEALDPLLQAHWVELCGVLGPVPYALNVEALQAAETADTWRLYTLRRDGALGGYLAVRLLPAFYHLTLSVAVVDTYYVLPSWRPQGYLLPWVAWLVSELEAWGAHAVWMPATGMTTTLGPIPAGEGWHYAALWYGKWLGEAPDG